MRRARWWIDDHRVLAALGVLGVGGLVLLAFLPGDKGDAPGIEHPEFAAAATDNSLDLVGVEEQGQAQRFEHAAADRDFAREGGKPSSAHPGIKTPANCSDVIGAPVIDIVSTGGSCEGARRLMSGYRSGFDPETRAIAGFTCTPTPETLRVSCTRAVDASNVALVFGPGGVGLADCGQSPITEDAKLSSVRARGTGCNAARSSIFEAFARGEPKDLRGYSCERRSIAGVATVRCSGERRALAFTLPG